MDPMYEVVPQPSKGVATIEPLEFAVGTVTNQSRQHCVGRTARGRAVYYQAHADAQGEETFQILLNRGRDFAEVYDVKISIIP